MSDIATKDPMKTQHQNVQPFWCSKGIFVKMYLFLTKIIISVKIKKKVFSKRLPHPFGQNCILMEMFQY